MGLFQFPQFGLLAGLLALGGAASRVGLALSSAVSASDELAISIARVWLTGVYTENSIRGAMRDKIR
jgi:hypothetical protein